MWRPSPTKTRLFGVLSSWLLILCASAQEEPDPGEVIVSVADQQLALIREGELIARFPISTSKFGLGDARGSYKTPLGRLRICDKIGDNLAAGTVLKGREATGEVLAVNAPGRDPIVTRILWLEGTEEQNRNARARAIYIHGTPEESRLGQPVSWGCIRMRSRDVIALYDQVSEGTPVTIIHERLPRLHRGDSHHEAILAQSKPVTKELATPSISSLSVTRELVSSLATGNVKAPNGKMGAHDAMKGSILFSGIPDASETEGSGIPQ